MARLGDHKGQYISKREMGVGIGRATTRAHQKEGDGCRHRTGDHKGPSIGIKLRGSKKRKWPGDGSRVGAGEELGGVGALVAACGGDAIPRPGKGYDGRP